MGLSQLPDEILLALIEHWPCRELQLRQLDAVLAPSRPSPSTIVVYGTRWTAKSGVVKSYLEEKGLRHVILRCQECVTARHLLERTVAAVHQTLVREDGEDDRGTYNARCENVSALVAHLQRLLKDREKFVLVFDGVDKQRDASPTLLPALARLGEFISNLTTVLIVRHHGPRFLHQTGVPHIHFTPYTREQMLRVVAIEPQDIFKEPPPPELGYDDEVHEEDKAWLWPRFCAAVWDSLGQAVARDFKSFIELCDKIWPRFVAPIVKGDFGTRDFSRLLVHQRKLFQEESLLLRSLISDDGAFAKAKSKVQDLPYYTKWLLIAAYLASHNPAKLDALYFMKSTEKKRRKKGGGTARSGGRPSQARKVPRHLLAPSQFTLDRLLAILHAILPHDLRSTIDVYTQIATLSSLKLLVRSAGIGSTDPLEPGTKWRLGPVVTWEYVQGLARSVKLDLVDYVVE